ncbi:MAG: hypothetical protein HN396_06320, partial [Gemmatimonadales bacterium]|nr:hypothetical protein [Gemmatimonadales bacterium]
MSTVEKDALNPAELADLVRVREEELSQLKARLAGWEETYEGMPKRDSLFESISGREVRPLYTPLDRT